MNRAAGAILLAAAIACGGAPAWAAEPVRADLSDHVVAITTGFTGTSLVLFGARQEPGEIVIVVRGPSARAVVRRRHHVLGFWLNTEGASFDDVPAFYATISNRPLDEIASADVLRLHRIGIQYLHPALRDRSDLGARRDADYRAALVRRQERAGRFVEKVGSIDFLGEHLFRTTLAFPSNVPVGLYAVEIFLFRDGALVAGQTVPLTVTEAGVDSNVSQFAQDEALVYGLIAVAATAMAGWLASFPLRNR
jgi:uncharacterized protein (TIGR02186 family)